MAEIRDIERLKRQVEDLKSEIAQAKGARSEALRNLEEEFGVKDISEARTLLKKLTKKEEESKGEFEEALMEFQSVYGERLNAERLRG